MTLILTAPDTSPRKWRLVPSVEATNLEAGLNEDRTGQAFAHAGGGKSYVYFNEPIDRICFAFVDSSYSTPIRCFGAGFDYADIRGRAVIPVPHISGQTVIESASGSGRYEFTQVYGEVLE